MIAFIDAATLTSMRRKRARGLVARWANEQGAKIAAARGKIVAGACRWEAESIASKRGADEMGAIILTKEQIELCEARAISSARIAAHGPWALDARDGGDRWTRETESVRASILQGVQPLRIGEPQDAAPANLEEIAKRPPTEDQRRVAEALKAKATDGKSPSPPASAEPQSGVASN